VQAAGQGAVAIGRDNRGSIVTYVFSTLSHPLKAHIIIAAGVVAAAVIVVSVPIAFHLAVSGGLQVAAFSVERLDDVPTDFIDARNGEVITSTQAKTPVIDITLKNTGKTTVVVKGAEFEVVSISRIERCNSGGGPQIASGKYDIALPDTLPTSLPKVLKKEIRHTIKPGDTDRLTFSIGRKNIVAYREPSWLFKVRASLTADSIDRPLLAGTALLASPLPQPYFFGLETSQSDPQCPQRNLSMFKEFLSGKGNVPLELRNNLSDMQILAGAIRNPAVPVCARGTVAGQSRNLVSIASFCSKFTPESLSFDIYFMSDVKTDDLRSAGLRIEIRANGRLVSFVSLIGSSSVACRYPPGQVPPTCEPMKGMVTLSTTKGRNSISLCELPPLIASEGHYNLSLTVSAYDTKPPGEPERVPPGEGYLEVKLGHS
jgi:hypothetical protein